MAERPLIVTPPVDSNNRSNQSAPNHSETHCVTGINPSYFPPSKESSQTTKKHERYDRMTLKQFAAMRNSTANNNKMNQAAPNTSSETHCVTGLDDSTKMNDKMNDNKMTAAPNTSETHCVTGLDSTKMTDKMNDNNNNNNNNNNNKTIPLQLESSLRNNRTSTNKTPIDTSIWKQSRTASGPSIEDPAYKPTTANNTTKANTTANNTISTPPPPPPLPPPPEMANSNNTTTNTSNYDAARYSYDAA
jgi:hypothetical protein